MSVSIIATGIRELDAKLKALPEKVQKKIARSALSQGMTIIAKAGKKAAPLGPTGNLRLSIGKRFKRNRQAGVTEAKVGISVGKRASKTNRAGAHGHLVALGTRPRFHKSGKSTGVMPANEFFRRATDAVVHQVQAKMLSVIIAKLEQEASR
jgi:HK97 gp10 family phage protein